MKDAERDRFLAWLKERGAEVLAQTSEWEVVRFRANGRTSIVYRNASGRISSCTGEAGPALRAFRRGLSWKAGPAKNKTRVRARSVVVRALIERDGDACFYCGRKLDDDCSVEHMLPRSLGGRNHLANLVLAHKSCNELAANLSIAEKVRLRERLHRRRRARVHA